MHISMPLNNRAINGHLRGDQLVYHVGSMGLYTVILLQKNHSNVSQRLPGQHRLPPKHMFFQLTHAGVKSAKSPSAHMGARLCFLEM